MKIKLNRKGHTPPLFEPEILAEKKQADRRFQTTNDGGRVCYGVRDGFGFAPVTLTETGGVLPLPSCRFEIVRSDSYPIFSRRYPCATPNKKRLSPSWAKSLILLVGREGLEPSTS